MKIPSWFQWVFAAISIIMAVDLILARFFGIGERQDSLFVAWCAMFVFWILSLTQIKDAKPPASDEASD
jgi:hypothetical protein